MLYALAVTSFQRGYGASPKNSSTPLITFDAFANSSSEMTICSCCIVMYREKNDYHHIAQRRATASVVTMILHRKKQEAEKKNDPQQQQQQQRPYTPIINNTILSAPVQLERTAAMAATALHMPHFVESAAQDTRHRCWCLG